MQKEEEEEQKEEKEKETTQLKIRKRTSLHYHFCEHFLKISALIMANIRGYLSKGESVCKLEPRDMGANDDLYYVLNMDFFFQK